MFCFQKLLNYWSKEQDIQSVNSVCHELTISVRRYNCRYKLQTSNSTTVATSCRHQTVQLSLRAADTKQYNCSYKLQTPNSTTVATSCRQQTVQLSLHAADTKQYNCRYKLQTPNSTTVATSCRREKECELTKLRPLGIGRLHLLNECTCWRTSNTKNVPGGRYCSLFYPKYLYILREPSHWIHQFPSALICYAVSQIISDCSYFQMCGYYFTNFVTDILTHSSLPSLKVLLLLIPQQSFSQFA